MLNSDLAPLVANGSALPNPVSPLGSPMADLSAVGVPVVGSVGYLNMLPFFWQKISHLAEGRTLFSQGEGDANLVFSSPRALNRRAHEGGLAAACMSAIAGLKSGFSVLQPSFGISTQSTVFSVFLEPILYGNAHSVEFWENIEQRNRGLLQCCLEKFSSSEMGFSADESGADLRLPPAGSAGAICLLSTGASEHSEWMARTLLRCQGFDVTVVYDTSLGALPRYEILKKARGLPCAILSIGDEALLRLALNPAAFRLDLGKLWRSFANLPPVFAAWFQTSNVAADSSQYLSLLHGAVAESLHSWLALSREDQVSTIESFLQQGGRNALHKHLSLGGSVVKSDVLAMETQMPSLLDYLNNIVYEFGQEQLKTIDTYKILLGLGFV